MGKWRQESPGNAQEPHLVVKKVSVVEHGDFLGLEITHKAPV